MIWIIVAHMTISGEPSSVIGNYYNVAFASPDACTQVISDYKKINGVTWECRKFEIRK